MKMRYLVLMVLVVAAVAYTYKPAKAAPGCVNAAQYLESAQNAYQLNPNPDTLAAVNTAFNFYQQCLRQEQE